uniref:Vesicle transport through interaction with t-SNAREs homolog 1A n=1 Tax=Plectus sambesii TaxID=2011161 RepID=A0A914WHU4_9BILA
MSLLAQFEQQYSVQTADITSKIGRLANVSAGERTEAIQTVERMLAEVEDLLEQMELSVRELPAGGADRNKYELRVKSYRSDKQQLNSELKKAIQRLKSGAADRSELFGYEEGSLLSSDQQNDQLIENTERLERSSRKLDDSYRMCIETEQIGAEVLNNLESQRETIGRARERLREADADLGQSSKVLSQMINRVIQNRLLMVGVGVVLFLAIIFIFWMAL